MSKIKNGGLDQYGKMESFNGIGGERVNELQRIIKSEPNIYDISVHDHHYHHVRILQIGKLATYKLASGNIYKAYISLVGNGSTDFTSKSYACYSSVHSLYRYRSCAARVCVWSGRKSARATIFSQCVRHTYFTVIVYREWIEATMSRAKPFSGHVCIYT